MGARNEPVQVKHAERCEHCGQRYVRIEAHRTKCAPRFVGAKAFHNPRLTAQENKACEMLFNGFTRLEIQDEMVISREHLAQLFARARRKGVAIPKAKTGTPGSRARVPLERLIKLRDDLIARGFLGAGLYRILAERVGMTEGCVNVRLWKYDHGLGPRPESERAQA